MHNLNFSFNTGSMEAFTSLLKNADLDPNKYENFRQVSILTLISNLTERVVLKRLSNHMHHNNLNIPNHSIKTVLLKLISIFILLIHRKATEALIHRVSNYPDLLPEIPRYCRPLVI